MTRHLSDQLLTLGFLLERIAIKRRVLRQEQLPVDDIDELSQLLVPNHENDTDRNAILHLEMLLPDHENLSDDFSVSHHSSSSLGAAAAEEIGIDHEEAQDVESLLSLTSQDIRPVQGGDSSAEGSMDGMFDDWRSKLCDAFCEAAS